MNLREANKNDLGELIKTVEWNGDTYEFYTNSWSTIGLTHDVLTMKRGGQYFKGEEVWSNRPYHKFSYENALDEVLQKAFGEKALELIAMIDNRVSDVTDAIDEFFKEFKAENIEHKTSSEDGEPLSRKAVLADYLEVSEDDLTEVSDDEFEVNDEEQAHWKVLTIEEADDLERQYVEELWDEQGLESINPDLRDMIIENAIDEDMANDFLESDMYDIINDMSDEEVIDEAIQLGLIEDNEIEDADIDSLREEIVEKRIENITDPVEYLLDIGLDDEYIESNFLDEEKVVDNVIDADIANGYEYSSIATYDGSWEEVDGYIIIRIE